VSMSAASVISWKSLFIGASMSIAVAESSRRL
jgi:hypothetical protein